MKIRVNPLTQRPSTSNLANALQQLQHDSLNNNTPRSTSATNSNNVQANLTNTIVTNFLTAAAQQTQRNQQATTATTNALSTTTISDTTITTPSATPTTNTTPTASRQPQRRRVRRKNNSSADDQAEHLTEMSVRGLDLFRYAKIFEGIYQCTECAKENIQKTFKNKYSFQRHAFLYHEGTQRKVFPCPVCQKEFSRPDKMKNHMKTTHECYMPKDTVYPLSFLAGGGGDMPANNQATGQTPQRKQDQEQQNNITGNHANNAENAKATGQQSASSLKIENVMSQYNAQIQAAAQLIKVENVVPGAE